MSTPTPRSRDSVAAAMVAYFEQLAPDERPNLRLGAGLGRGEKLLTVICKVHGRPVAFVQQTPHGDALTGRNVDRDQLAQNREATAEGWDLGPMPAIPNSVDFVRPLASLTGRFPVWCHDHGDLQLEVHHVRNALAQGKRVLRI